TNKSGELPKPRGSFGGRLTSTEGFERWFRADNGVSQAIQTWEEIPRVLLVGDSELVNWRLSVFSEATDGKGTRHWVAWDSIPADFATVKGMGLSKIQTLFEFASECRKYFYTCGRIATGGGKDVPAVVVGQSAFYTSIMPIIAEFVVDHNDTNDADLRQYAARVRDTAVRGFDATSQPFLTPNRIANVARARNQFRRSVGTLFAKRFPELSSSEIKDAS
ncbi:MAG: hypothetical protein ACK5L6_02815, partial [Anaerorhabdus sp.]|uniref:hypothetical protein n=1 Tax=Anaerorhabdus sp. TaxID=1872524 RepID=UPI003A8813DB